MSSSQSRLFESTKIGDLELKHRIVLAPLTRLRANADHVHGDLAVEYYRQRASVPGTLLISESITIAPECGGRPHVPGIWSEEQIQAWRKASKMPLIEACIAKFCFYRLRMPYMSKDPSSSLR